jgi:nuclear pore complex protein Nup93
VVPLGLLFSYLAKFPASSFTSSLQMHQKMMAYDRVISELTSARIGGVSYPIVHSLLDATRSAGGDVRVPMSLLAFYNISVIVI